MYTCFMEQLIIWFNEPVNGKDPVTKEIFKSNRHRIAASAVNQNSETTNFVTSDGTVVGEWPTQLIGHWIWPQAGTLLGDEEATEDELRWGTRAWREWAQSEFQNAWTRWTPEQDADVTQAFKSGVTLTEITQLAGRSPKGVLVRLKKLGEIAEEMDIEQLEIELRVRSLDSTPAPEEIARPASKGMASEEVRRQAWREILDKGLVGYRSDLIRQPGNPEIDLRVECENCRRWVSPGEAHDCPF